jgi:hypothetical protein
MAGYKFDFDEEVRLFSNQYDIDSDAARLILAPFEGKGREAAAFVEWVNRLGFDYKKIRKIGPDVLVSLYCESGNLSRNQVLEWARPGQAKNPQEGLEFRVVDDGCDSCSRLDNEDLALAELDDKELEVVAEYETLAAEGHL